MEYKVWRQAYYNNEGTLRPAKPIARSDKGFVSAINELSKDWICSTKGNSVTSIRWCGLQLYDNEMEANKEPFNINKYGN
jgi:hypothetical protein